MAHDHQRKMGSKMLKRCTANGTNATSNKLMDITVQGRIQRS